MSLESAVRAQIEAAIDIQARYDNGSLPRTQALHHLRELGASDPEAILDRTTSAKPVRFSWLKLW